MEVNHRLQFAVADRGFERRGVQVVKLVRTQMGCGGLRPPSHADYPTKCVGGAATPVVASSICSPRTRLGATTIGTGLCCRFRGRGPGGASLATSRTGASA